MLAPPDNRRRKRERKPIVVRRADDRRRKRLQLKREALRLHRCELWLPAIVIEGLSRQLIMDGLLTDEQAFNHHCFEAALAALLTAQGTIFSR